MSDKNSYFNIEDLDGLGDVSSKMTDEELDRYLAAMDDEAEPVREYKPVKKAPPPTPMPTKAEQGAPASTSAGKQSSADMEATTISDLGLLGLLHSTPDASREEATNVIPPDVRRIYEFTENHGVINQGKPVKKQTPKPEGEEPQYDPRNYRPIHRNRRHRTGCMGGLLYFLFVLCISVVLACLGWVAANDVLSLNKPELLAVVELPDSIFTEHTDDEGEKYTVADISYVASALKRAGIIEYPILFRMFAKISNASKKVDPGEYTLSTSYDYRAIVAHLQESAAYSTEETTKVTIPEGKTLAQAFEMLEEAGVCKASKLWDSAANTEYDYDFLSPDTLGDQHRLEGFLFPDTYEFWINMNPDNVLRKFLDNFDAKFTEEMRLAAQQKDMSIHEIVTVASLIEMEAANDQERPTIASVIYNRLHSDSYPFLQIDATIQYILPERKESLTYDDLLIDDPYNTYMYKGLPPGPIANPGIASIKAALEPESTGYYFYALNKEKAHSFFADYDAFTKFTESDEFGG